jgi:TolB-like protein/DNA-binding winged helix-turn-helix (wHTH) protein
METALSRQTRGEKSTPAPREFRIGLVDVQPGSGRIAGPGGTRNLDPKVMAVLVRLAEAHGEVVPRETLMKEVWPDTVVTDFALSRCIYQLRKNLSQAALSEDSPIETLPKRGYRLTWPVEEIDAVQTVEAKRHRPLLAIVAGTALVVAGIATWFAWVPTAMQTARPAIAVMPFVDQTQAGDLGYFGDGLATTLLMELGHIREIDVIARSSSFYFRDDKATIDEIGETLNINYLVEGSVNLEGETIQVTAALVEISSGRQVWSDTFEGNAGQMFTAQVDIAGEVANYLELSLGDPRRHGGTSNFEALKAYLRAFESNQPELSGDYLDQALAQDPDYAHALEAKAYNIYIRYWQGDGILEQAWTEAQPLLERALEITDESPWSHGLMAGFQIQRGEYESAEASLEQAMQINPSFSWAFVHLSRLMEQTGRIHEAVELAERNVRLDPMNAFRHLQLANRRWTAGNIASGKESFERAIELNPTNYAAWHNYALRLSNMEGALAGFQLVARLQQNPEFRSQFTGAVPKLKPGGVGLFALWLGFLNDFERAQAMLELQSRLGDSGELHRELGWSLLARGDLEGANREARIAIEGIPRDDTTQILIADIALRSGEGMDDVLTHYRQYWPGLFENPPDTADIPGKIVIASALINRIQGNEPQAIRLLESLLEETELPADIRAMAMAHLGDISAALETLETHIDNGGSISSTLGNPFWVPLADEPRFMTIVESSEAEKAAARMAVNDMLLSGELILPGHIDL